MSERIIEKVVGSMPVIMIPREYFFDHLAPDPFPGWTIFALLAHFADRMERLGFDMRRKPDCMYDKLSRCVFLYQGEENLFVVSEN